MLLNELGRYALRRRRQSSRSELLRGNVEGTCKTRREKQWCSAVSLASGKAGSAESGLLAVSELLGSGSTPRKNWS